MRFGRYFEEIAVGATGAVGAVGAQGAVGAVHRHRRGTVIAGLVAPEASYGETTGGEQPGRPVSHD